MRSDPYYNPEEFGLTIIGEVDFSDGHYCFDLRVIWVHNETGVYYTARDSGCSCPSPFEDYHSIEQLDRLDIAELLRELEEERMNDCRGADIASLSAWKDVLRRLL